jgi:hypothetical protein
MWGPLWRRRAALRGRALPLAATAVTMILASIGYQVTARLNATWGVTLWDPATQFDKRIPFLEWSILPYTLAYAFGPITAILLPRTNRARRQFLLVCQGQLLLAAISTLCFVCFPCRVRLIEQIPSSTFEQEGVIAHLFRIVHYVDRPYNAYPSLHISMSLLLMISIGVFAWFTRLPRVLMYCAWCLVAVSVHTTKQHYLFDSLTGAALCLAVWICYLRPKLSAVCGSLPRGVLANDRN